LRILLVNDDGIHADGLHAVWHALNEEGHEVFVCVPDRPRSACAHQITMHKALRVKQVETRDGVAHTLNSTPGDCVPVALKQLMPQAPHLVISGINLGANLGDDVHYSGTVAGAMEARLNGVPAMAVSLIMTSQSEVTLWEGAVRFCVDFAPQVPQLALARDTFLNVNVPNLPMAQLQGVRVTSQGSRRYKGDITRHEAPLVGVFYWRGGEVTDRAESPDADVAVVQEGCISVTPLHVDMTRRDAFPAVQAALEAAALPFYKGGH
jgi:5'-nucleotidase